MSEHDVSLRACAAGFWVAVCVTLSCGAPRVQPQQAAAGTAQVQFFIDRDYAPDTTDLAADRTRVYAEASRFADALEAELRHMGYDTTTMVLSGGDVNVSLQVLMAGDPSSEPQEAALLVTAWVFGKKVESTLLVFDPGDELDGELEGVLAVLTRGTVLRRGLAAHNVRATNLRVGEANKLDDEAWSAARSYECVRPSKATACDGVWDYLQRHPVGAHAQEANRIAAEGQRIISRLPEKKEAEYWSAAQQQCPGSQTLCGRLMRSYLCYWPCGPNAEAAKRDVQCACPAECGCPLHCSGQCGMLQDRPASSGGGALGATGL